MKRHRTDLLSMFSGLVFLGLGGVFVTGRVDAIDVEAQWLWPLPLILGGLFIFFAAFRSEPEAEVAGVEEVTEPVTRNGADELTQHELRADDVTLDEMRAGDSIVEGEPGDFGTAEDAGA